MQEKMQILLTTGKLWAMLYTYLFAKKQTADSGEFTLFTRREKWKTIGKHHFKRLGAKTMKYPDLPFGEYVRERREQLGKTLRGFAADLEISPAYLHDIETGNRRAPEKLLDKMAVLLHITETNEVHQFYDLAGVSQNGQHTDINLYMNHVPSARAALRTAKDANLTDEDWQKLIEIIKKKKL